MDLSRSLYRVLTIPKVCMFWSYGLTRAIQLWTNLALGLHAKWAWNKVYATICNNFHPLLSSQCIIISNGYYCLAMQGYSCLTCYYDGKLLVFLGISIHSQNFENLLLLMVDHNNVGYCTAINKYYLSHYPFQIKDNVCVCQH